MFTFLAAKDSTRMPGVMALIFLALGFLGVAFALRFVFLNWGLPYIYHPDEPGNLAIIHRMIAESDFNPRWFNYPSFLFYINLPRQYVVKWLHGSLLPWAMQSMGNGFTEQPEAFQAARATTLLFGLAILPVLIVWARTLSVGMAGLFVLGALFCLNPLLLRHSTFISPDVFAAFFTTSTLLASSLIVLRGDRWTYIAAGVAAGLAASSKYNAGLVAVAISAAHVARYGFTLAKLRPLVLAAATTVLVFLLSSPFIALHPRQAAHGILFHVILYQRGHAGHEGHSLATNSMWMFDNFGYAGLLAIAACFSPRVRALLPTVIFVIAYFLLLVMQYVRFDRNLLPLVPAIVLLVAVGTDSVAKIVARALPDARRLTSAISALLALALFARPAMLSLAEIDRYNQDPRAEGRVWANEQLPRTPERVILVDPYVPYITENGRAIIGSTDLILEMDRAALDRFSYLVLSRQGSGRFFQGPYEIERAKFKDLKADFCGYRQFPDNTAEPEYLILIFRCE
jgi:hypothetical protein